MSETVLETSPTPEAPSRDVLGVRFDATTYAGASARVGRGRRVADRLLLQHAQRHRGAGRPAYAYASDRTGLTSGLDASEIDISARVTR